MRGVKALDVTFFILLSAACSSSSPEPTGFGHDAGGGKDASSGSSSGGSSGGGSGSSSGGGSGSSSGSSGAGQCMTAMDCRTQSDDCGECTCLALGANEPAPDCDGGTMKCSPDPCAGQTVMCNAMQQCALQ